MSNRKEFIASKFAFNHYMQILIIYSNDERFIVLSLRMSERNTSLQVGIVLYCEIDGKWVNWNSQVHSMGRDMKSPSLTMHFTVPDDTAAIRYISRRASASNANACSSNFNDLFPIHQHYLQNFVSFLWNY